MSDGNINRNLLPYKNYQSGVRAGRASMRTLACDTLNALLQAEDLDATTIERLSTSFRNALNKL